MNWLNRFLQRWVPFKDLSWKEHGETFYRYFLYRRSWWVCIHYFHHENLDQPCHDHPWDFVTFILWGGYWEITPSGKEWVGAGNIRRRRAEFKHEIACPNPSWSLVFMGPKRRQWGKCSPLHRPAENE